MNYGNQVSPQDFLNTLGAVARSFQGKESPEQQKFKDNPLGYTSRYLMNQGYENILANGTKTQELLKDLSGHFGADIANEFVKRAYTASLPSNPAPEVDSRYMPQSNGFNTGPVANNVYHVPSIQASAENANKVGTDLAKGVAYGTTAGLAVSGAGALGAGRAAMSIVPQAARLLTNEAGPVLANQSGKVAMPVLKYILGSLGLAYGLDRFTANVGDPGYIPVNQKTANTIATANKYEETVYPLGNLGGYPLREALGMAETDSTLTHVAKLRRPGLIPFRYRQPFSGKPVPVSEYLNGSSPADSTKVPEPDKPDGGNSNIYSGRTASPAKPAQHYTKDNIGDIDVMALLDSLARGQ